MNSTDKSSSHQERVAAHSARVADLATKRDRILERAKAEIGAAQTAHKQDHAQALLDHHAAHEAAFSATQRSAIEALIPFVEAFQLQADRNSAANLAAEFRRQDSAAIVATGEPLANSLAHAFASVMAASEPAVLPVFANFRSYHSSVTGCLEACEAASQALRNPSPAAAARQLQALIALESNLSHVAATGQKVNSEIAVEAFDIVRFGGSKSAVQAALDTLEKPVVDLAQQAAAAAAVNARLAKSKGMQVLGALSDFAAYTLGQDK